jgi:GcrA cell cycle regulator
MTRKGERSWPAEELAELERLWREGFSTAEIARRMHKRKDQILGMAHREDLPSRPSPIKRKVVS